MTVIVDPTRDLKCSEPGCGRPALTWIKVRGVPVGGCAEHPEIVKRATALQARHAEADNRYKISDRFPYGEKRERSS
jgi:hypothetical protein